MPIRKIAQLGHPVLRRPAATVAPEELASPRIQSLVDDLIETMRDADGAGLAAPQVHESLRIAVLEVRDNPRYPTFPRIPLTVLVNPVLTREVIEEGRARPLGPHEEAPRGQGISLYEGCLSVAGVRGRVRRPRRVSVHALDREGRTVSFTWEGVPAAVLQHECDHLDGVLFVDRADPRTLAFLREWERAVPPEERVVDEG